MDDYKLESGMDDTNIIELADILQEPDIIENIRNINDISEKVEVIPRLSKASADDIWTPEQKKIMYELGNTQTLQQLAQVKPISNKEKPKSVPALKWYNLLDAIKKITIASKEEWTIHMEKEKLAFPEIEFRDYRPEWNIVYSSDAEEGGASRRVALLNKANSKSGYWPPGLWDIRSRKVFDSENNYFVKSLTEVRFIMNVDVDETGVYVRSQKKGQRSWVVQEST